MKTSLSQNMRNVIRRNHRSSQTKTVMIDLYIRNMRLAILFLAIILPAFFLVSCAKGERTMKTHQLTIAPNFSLKDEENKEHKLSDYKDQYVLIYFYPKDDTPGCTAEACAIRDFIDGFSERGIKVLGISPDNPESHKKFKEKYHLPFTLLADQNQEVAKLYNADGMFLKRISYLIAPGGEIIKHYPKVNPNTHANQILEDFDKLKQ